MSRGVYIENMTTTHTLYCSGSGARTPVIRDASETNQWHYKRQPCPVCGALLVPQRQGTVRKHKPGKEGV